MCSAHLLQSAFFKAVRTTDFFPPLQVKVLDRVAHQELGGCAASGKICSETRGVGREGISFCTGRRHRRSSTGRCSREQFFHCCSSSSADAELQLLGTCHPQARCWFSLLCVLRAREKHYLMWCLVRDTHQAASTAVNHLARELPSVWRRGGKALNPLSPALRALILGLYKGKCCGCCSTLQSKQRREAFSMESCAFAPAFCVQTSSLS